MNPLLGLVMPWYTELVLYLLGVMVSVIMFFAGDVFIGGSTDGEQKINWLEAVGMGGFFGVIVAAFARLSGEISPWWGLVIGLSTTSAYFIAEGVRVALQKHKEKHP